METKNNAIRDARTLGIPKMLLLGLQHMFAMFGATILVPILVTTILKERGSPFRLHYSAPVSAHFSSICVRN